MRTSIAVFAALLALAVPTAHAQTGSGNDLLEACVNAGPDFQAETKDKLEVLQHGMCLGTVQAIVTLGESLEEPFKFCPPNGILGQAVVVLVKFLRDHPHRLNAPMIDLAVEAYREAWPCGRK